MRHSLLPNGVLHSRYCDVGGHYWENDPQEHVSRELCKANALLWVEHNHRETCGHMCRSTYSSLYAVMSDNDDIRRVTNSCGEIQLHSSFHDHCKFRS